MIDFHIHPQAFFSPSEAAHCGRQAGNRSVALLARCHKENLETELLPLVRAVRQLTLYNSIDAIAGVELVHVPSGLLPETVAKARELGAQIVVGHGESVLPHGAVVPKGANLSAIEAGVDLLAHPGLLTEEEALCAVQKGCALELSLAPWHSMYNGHVAKVALKHGCMLVAGSNAREACDMIWRETAHSLLMGAGMDEQAMQRLERDALTLMTRCLRNVTPCKI